MTEQRRTFLKLPARDANCFRWNGFVRFVNVATPLLRSGAVMPFLRACSPSRFRTRGAALIILAVAIIFSVSASVSAAGNHRGFAVGANGRAVRQYKLDDELTRRAARTGTTRVIVTLQPGAQLPPDLQRFSHSKKIGIINGHVVDVPNRRLAQ